jgi:hypothetical protein
MIIVLSNLAKYFTCAVQHHAFLHKNSPWPCAHGMDSE